MIEKWLQIADSIAEEIAEAVEANEFSRTFEPSVIWGDRRTELSKEGELAVHVVPVNWSTILDSDGSWRIRCRYQIGVRKRFTAAERDVDGQVIDSEITALCQILGELQEWFMPKKPDQDGRRLTDVPSAVWVSDTNEDGEESIDAMIDWDWLRDKKMFLGWFDLTFEADG